MPPVSRVCCIPTCGRTHYSKGFCRRCYDLDAKGELNYRGRRICTMPDCGKPWHSLERCNGHSAALQREQARKYRESLGGNFSKGRSSPNETSGTAA